MFDKAVVLLLGVTALQCVRTSHGHPVSGTAIKLNTSPASGHGQHVEPQRVTCSLEASLTPMEKVTSLTLLAAKPYGRRDEFDPLVAVDLWTAGPQLLSGVEASEVDVSGKIGSGDNTKSHLNFSWKSGRNSQARQYRCVANGLDKSGRAVTLSIASESEIVTSSGCRSNMGARDDLRLLTQTILDGVNNSTADLQASVETVGADVATLQRTVDSLEGLVKAQNSTIESLREYITSFTEMYRFTHLMKNFDVSEAFNGKRYFASKSAAPFNIQAADTFCANLGGYLVEIDDQEEFNFVLTFAKGTAGDVYFTGGNDIDVEGMFRFWHSKRPVTFFKWRTSSEPNNGRGNENCIDITASMNGFNDRACDAVGKYICEGSA